MIGLEAFGKSVPGQAKSVMADMGKDKALAGVSGEGVGDVFGPFRG